MWKEETEVAGQRLPGSMATYSEAVDEFSKQSAELLAHIPVLTKARDAYQRAIKISAEIRTMLDTRDEPAESDGSVGRGGRGPFGQILVG